jgi:hypothetical protein
MYSVYYGNKDASSFVCDVDHCVIIKKLVDSIFSIVPVFIHRWKIQIYLHQIFVL